MEEKYKQEIDSQELSPREVLLLTGFRRLSERDQQHLLICLRAMEVVPEHDES